MLLQYEVTNAPLSVQLSAVQAISSFLRQNFRYNNVTFAKDRLWNLALRFSFCHTKQHRSVDMPHNEHGGPVGDGPLLAPEVPGSKLFTAGLLVFSFQPSKPTTGQHCRYNQRRVAATVPSFRKNQLS